MKINAKDNSLSLVICDFSSLTTAEKEPAIVEVRRVLAGNGTAWIQFKKDDFLVLHVMLTNNGLINHLENDLIVDSDNRHDFFHVTKSDKFTWNSTEVLRPVVVPYTTKGIDGKRIKRGWDFYGDKPMRWTSLGNVITSSDMDIVYSLLILSSSNLGDSFFSWDKGICDIAKTLRRECDGSKVDSLLEKLKAHVSTSERESELSFNKRQFMPKE